MIDDEDILSLVDESDESEDTAECNADPEITVKPKAKPTLNDLNRCARSISGRIAADEKISLEVMHHGMAKKRQAKKRAQQSQQKENK